MKWILIEQNSLQILTSIIRLTILSQIINGCLDDIKHSRNPPLHINHLLTYPIPEIKRASLNYFQIITRPIQKDYYRFETKPVTMLVSQYSQKTHLPLPSLYFGDRLFQIVYNPSFVPGTREKAPSSLASPPSLITAQAQDSWKVGGVVHRYKTLLSPHFRHFSLSARMQSGTNVK